MYVTNRRQALFLTVFIILLISAFAAVTPIVAAAPTIKTSKPTYTINETVSVSGTANPNSLVSIQVFDPHGVRKAIAQATADNEGRYSLDKIYKVGTADLEGTWTVKAYEGGVAAITTFEVVGLDITPPALSITVTPEKKTYKDEDIRIDLIADENLEKPVVEVAQKGTIAKAVTMSPVKGDLRKWSGIYTITAGYDGPATIEVSAKDLAENRASATASVKVDTTPPTLTITGPTRTETAEVEVSGTVDDPAVAIVEVGVTGVSPKTVSVSDGKWSITLTLPATGTNTITAKAADPAGNTGTASAIIIYVGPIEVIADNVKKIEQRMTGMEEKVESGLSETRTTSEKGIADVKTEMEALRSSVDAQVKGQMEETRSTIKTEMTDTRASIESEITALREQLVNEVSTLYIWVLVAVILCLVAAVAATISVITIARKIVMK